MQYQFNHCDCPICGRGTGGLIDFVFFAGIGGALQAMATPVLDVGFPHFRYFHFFYTHIGIISNSALLLRG